MLTGAGISTESGIPDFRSPGGVWANNQPVLYHDFVRSGAARQEYWRQKSVAHEDFAQATANVGHRVLAAWEARGLIRGVITQNIDGLHQMAGSQDVLELHGTARDVSCLNCQFRDSVDEYVVEFLNTGRVPSCPRCGGLLKHATISFGQSLPIDVLSKAEQWSRDADLFFALGTSLTVSPAAELPRIAVGSGAKLVIINRTETPLDEIADIVIRENLGSALRALDLALGDSD